MEVRGERRGFMETMRAFFTIIKKRIGQRRTQQRTNNYRICRNLAMAKIESKKERRLKKLKVTKESNSANVTALNSVNRKADGAPRGLRERMKSALKAFREGRKPYWVRQRGWRGNIDDLNMEDTQAEEDLHEPQAKENIKTQARENLRQTYTSHKIEVRVDIHTQPEEDIPFQARDNMDGLIMEYTQAGEDLHELQVREDLKTQARENLQETQASPDTHTGEDIQTQAQEDVLPDGPASWVVAHGQMWQKMAQHDGRDLYGEDLHATQATEEPASWVVASSQMWQRIAERYDQDLYVEGAYDTQARESLDDNLAREGLEADEPASWFVANGQIWGNTHKDNHPVTCSMPIMNSWLSSVNMENRAGRGMQVTGPYKHTGMF